MILPRYKILSRSHHYFLVGSVTLGNFKLTQLKVVASIEKSRAMQCWMTWFTSFDYNAVENGSTYHYPKRLEFKYMYWQSKCQIDKYWPSNISYWGTYLQQQRYLALDLGRGEFLDAILSALRELDADHEILSQSQHVDLTLRVGIAPHPTQAQGSFVNNVDKTR